MCPILTTCLKKYFGNLQQNYHLFKVNKNSIRQCVLLPKLFNHSCQQYFPALLHLIQAQQYWSV